jgi:hypothetical protein
VKEFHLLTPEAQRGRAATKTKVEFLNKLWQVVKTSGFGTTENSMFAPPTN